jgi:hypothetical protein
MLLKQLIDLRSDAEYKKSFVVAQTARELGNMLGFEI